MDLLIILIWRTCQHLYYMYAIYFVYTYLYIKYALAGITTIAL